eukprot:scaffold73240_cov61-Attheya_sp.AAC.3
MRYFYFCDQAKEGNFNVKWHPGLENLGHNTTKHHETKHHVNVRPIYLHMKESPRTLPRAMKPSDLRGCVGNKAGGYRTGRPLPIIPRSRPHNSSRSNPDPIRNQDATYTCGANSATAETRADDDAGRACMWVRGSCGRDASLDYGNGTGDLSAPGGARL